MFWSKFALPLGTALNVAPPLEPPATRVKQSGGMGAQVVAREALDHAVTYHLEPLRQVSLLSHAEEERGQMSTSTIQRVKPPQICVGSVASFAQTRSCRKMEDALPPLGVAEVLPVVGMLLAIAIAILYGCGCLGSGAAPSARPAPGSGSKGFVRNPEGFQDDDDDEDSEDEKDR